MPLVRHHHPSSSIDPDARRPAKKDLNLILAAFRRPELLIRSAPLAFLFVMAEKIIR